MVRHWAAGVVGVRMAPGLRGNGEWRYQEDEAADRILQVIAEGETGHTTGCGGSSGAQAAAQKKSKRRVQKRAEQEGRSQLLVDGSTRYRRRIL